MRLRNCDMNDFAKRIKDKKIICFGTGLLLNSMIYMYDYPWDSMIKYIVDNNKLLWDEEYQVKGYKYKIYSPDNLSKEDAGINVIVIFTQKFTEVMEQLDEIRALDDMDCYIFSLMQTYTNLEDGEFKTALDVKKIPPVIHYCWFGRKPLSDEAKACLESWKKYCPDFEIECWNEDNYDVKKNKYIEEAYENGAYAFVSDFARLDILYENGGIYLDVDVEVRKDLTPLLYNEAYCAFANHVPRINTGLGMGAVKGFPILKDMMDIYKYESYVDISGFNQTLCQIYNDKVLTYHGLAENGRYQVIKNLTCYPKDYFDPKSSHLGIMPNVERAFSIHHSANTWAEQGDVAFKKIKMISKNRIQDILDRIKETENR